MLSIIVPTKDSRLVVFDLIEEIEKFSKTNGFDIELIIVLDKGEDSKLEKDLFHFIDLQPNTSLSILKERSGQALALRYGINQATRSYILTVDDDLYLNEILQKVQSMLPLRNDLVYFCDKDKKRGFVSQLFHFVMGGLYLKKPRGSYIRLFKTRKFSINKSLIEIDLLPDVKDYSYEFLGLRKKHQLSRYKLIDRLSLVFYTMLYSVRFNIIFFIVLIIIILKVL